MKQEAIEAGFTDEDIPKIQILTAEDLLAGRMPAVPQARVGAPQVNRP